MEVLKPHVFQHRPAHDLALCVAAQLAQTEPDDVERNRSNILACCERLPLDEEAQLHTRIVLSVLCDLRAHGWTIALIDGGVHVAPPNREALSPIDQKNSVRNSLQRERDAQLCEPSVRRFVRRMEQKQPHRGAWKSVFSLMRDGSELARQLRSARDTSVGDGRVESLRSVIDPYVQVVERGNRCEHTGLDLQDVWRYFRYTWVTPYRSVPGRQTSFLIRDRAAENHPVIGIGAIASSVMQQKRRDNWIGWHPSAFMEALNDDGYQGWPKWLRSSLIELIDGIYIADFKKEGVITTKDLTNPSREVIDRLRQVSREARAAHRLYHQNQQHKSAAQNARNSGWRVQAQTHLFRSKRAATLAQLLQALYDLSRAGFVGSSADELRRAAATSHGRRAVKTVLRLVKASHAGVDMMDITVCGAIAPYGPILGGKLVSLLLTSPDVVHAYTQRYRQASSIIASSMAGRAVSRPPRLVLLMTTSLYRVASSQYNRLKLPAELYGGRGTLQFIDLAQTAGFGSYHFSKTTIDAIEVLVAQSARGREVNSIFGEGVNPKLRKMRSGLQIVGLPSDQLLKHGSPRIVYGVPLASNFRQILTGRQRRPQYFLRGKAGTDAIVRFWLERWLSRRIEQEAVLAAVSQHTTSYPFKHGARVVLPKGAPDERYTPFELDL